MVDISKLFNAVSDDRSNLTELKISRTPVAVLIFTTEADEISLHYEQDATVRGWVACAGPGCLYCRFGDQPQAHVLLPVFHIESGAVRLLRISAARGPKTLIGQLAPYLSRADTRDIAVVITKVGFDFLVQHRQLGAAADRGDEAVKQFAEDVKNGLKLSSVIRHMTPDEMAEIPRIRRLLDTFDEPPASAGA